MNTRPAAFLMGGVEVFSVGKKNSQAGAISFLTGCHKFFLPLSRLNPQKNGIESHSAKFLITVMADKLLVMIMAQRSM